MECAGLTVIDEDSEFGIDRDQNWADFRSVYLRRHFCLLVAVSRFTAPDDITLPVGFESDPLVVIEWNIRRDIGDESMVSNWVAKCGLDRYTSTNVALVGLFIDASSSLYEVEVAAGRDMFINNLNAKNIQVMKVVSFDEDWISPFLTVLV